MNTRFALRPYDKITSERLEHAGILRPIAQALAARGIRGPEDLLEDWRSMLAPSMLEGANCAASLLADAIAARRRITVVADYDCDGATACAIAVRGLTMMATCIIAASVLRLSTAVTVTSFSCCSSGCSAITWSASFA